LKSPPSRCEPSLSFLSLFFFNLSKLERLDYRIKQWNIALEKYVADLESTHKKSVVVLGDLNVAHRDADVYNFNAPHLKKQAGCTVEEREAFTNWLNKGYVDAFRHVHGEARGAYTYWSTRANNREGNKGLRLDYFVVSENMTKNVTQQPQVLDSYVLDTITKVSDHAPVVLVLARA
jgi:exodeoxyribonuclease III